MTVAHGLAALPTPGHTPGHYAFIWQDVALIGDAAMTGRSGELRSNPTVMNSDVEQCATTRAILTELPARLFCPGHGFIVERAAP